MSKTLYITDLDGTLLNSEANLSEYTKNTINRLVEQGMYFTFATARTIYSAESITEGLNINVPCIVNNGAEIYDMKSGKYVRKFDIPIDAAARIIDAFAENNVGMFMFKFRGEKFGTCYNDNLNELMQEYVRTRRKTGQPLWKCTDLHSENDGNVVYLTSTGDYEKLLPIERIAASVKGLDHVFYEDTYTGKHYLEIFSENASKANGLKYLRAQYGFEKIVAFGDNLNDLSMFREADVKIAVGNARDELKQQADFIIRSNDEDGVAHYILNSLN
ncbi:MAG: HAD family hydrolase [Ruminococcus sp.]|nr:HAD family hydrolase [Ruminococcus sp.]